jgi:hypothetical protein
MGGLKISVGFKVIRTKLNGRGARASQRSEPNAKLVGLPLRPCGVKGRRQRSTAPPARQSTRDPRERRGHVANLHVACLLFRNCLEVSNFVPGTTHNWALLVTFLVSPLSRQFKFSANRTSHHFGRVQRGRGRWTTLFGVVQNALEDRSRGARSCRVNSNRKY